MALSIGVNRGSKIDVGDQRVVVVDFPRESAVTIKVGLGPDILITDRSLTQILPEVFVFVGRGAHGTTHKLAFEAPRSIPIHRVKSMKGA